MYHTLLFLGSFGMQELIIILFFMILPVALLIWAITDLLKRTTMNDTNRLIWALVILFVPFFGALVYLIAGRSTRSNL